MSWNAETYTTDVLVVGAGLAGCWAALKCRQRGLEVTLIDKGEPGHTGCSRFASGDFKCMLPDSDFDACMRKIVEGSAFLGHQEWIEIMLRDGYDCVLEMESLGIRFKTNPDGTIHRTGDVLPQLTIGSGYLMPRFREVLRGLGVNLLGRSFLRSLIQDETGRVCGARVLDTREDRAMLFEARCVILASGSCSLRASYYGHQFSTGDGYSAALKAGCRLLNMEATNHNVSLKAFDTTGGTFFREHGVKYLNSAGEDVSRKHKGIPLAQAMAFEVRDGLGPIYMDLSSVKMEDFEEALDVMPWLKIMFEKAEIKMGVVECVPAFGGSRATSAGILADTNGRTSVEGLFATGDAAAMLGNGMGAMGVNLLNCSVFGRRCGQSAGDYALGVERPRGVAPEAGIGDRIQDPGAIDYSDMLIELQKTVLPWDVSIVRSERRLRDGIERLKGIRADMSRGIAWNDRHGLIKALELANMVDYCEAMLKSSLARTESRGLHYREDYPHRDDHNWLKWVAVSGRAGDLITETIRMPESAFKYVKPDAEMVGEHGR